MTRIETPRPPDVHDIPSFVAHVETVNGRIIGKYIQGLTGRRVYTVGKVGFFHLDEARDDARRGAK